MTHRPAYIFALLFCCLPAIADSLDETLDRLDQLDTEAVTLWEQVRKHHQDADEPELQQIALVARTAAEMMRSQYGVYELIRDATDPITPPDVVTPPEVVIPPQAGDILVQPGQSLAQVFADLAEGQTIRLPLGATFDEPLPIPPNRTTVGVYGEGDRPVVRGFSQDRGSREAVTIEGIHFKPMADNPDRVFRLVGNWTDLKLIDCKFEGGTHGIVLQGESASRRHIRPLVERCIYGGQHTDGKFEAKGIGLFAKNTAGLIIRESVAHDVAYDHPRTTYSQANYIELNTEGTLIDRCVMIRVGAAGFQIRSGGIVRDSIIIRQSIHSWITGAGSSIERCLAIYPEDLTFNPVDGFLPRGGGFQVNFDGEESSLIDNQVYHDRGTNNTHGAYKFEVDPDRVELRGNLAGDFNPTAERQGRAFTDPGILEVIPPEVSQLEAWADALIDRPYGEPFPDVAAQIQAIRAAAKDQP